MSTSDAAGGLDAGVVARLREVADRHADLERMLGDPVVAQDGARMSEIAQQHAELAEVVRAWTDVQDLAGDAGAAREMAAETTGEEAAQMRDEAARLDAARLAREATLRLLLLPKDPHDGKDVIVEVRAAAGGDEAGLFAGELADMYRSYAARRGWRVQEISSSPQGIGGVKEATFEVTGRDAWGLLKHESGVHRVQRVPATESQGRIHTSTASVAVLPSAEEVDVRLDPNELRIDVTRSSGPGGQSVNTTDSAVRITHLPTGMVVTCQDQKSQHQNRDRAMKVLRSRLLQLEQERADAERADARRGQIGTGDRSEKIRTYNFPQSRITDHRIGLTVHNLAGVLGGDLDEVVETLRQVERSQQLADGDGS